MTVKIFADARETAEALAAALVDELRARPHLVMALPTGSTPLPMYAALRRAVTLEPQLLAQARTFNLDEFAGVAADDPASYRSYMERELFQPTDMSARQVGFLDGCAADLEAECDRYEQHIADAGGLDVAVLGLGGNGHIGFNEPALVLQARTHVTALEPTTRLANARWFGHDLNRVPHRALSMGVGTLLGARRIMLMATGEGKRRAVSELRSGRVTTQVPASLLQCHPAVTLWLDRDAATS